MSAVELVRGFVGAGFMPAFKFNKKLFVFERGHKVRAYKATPARAGE